MEFAFFWFVFAIAVGVLAHNRGRSGFGWFLLSVVISPLLGLVFCAVSANLKNELPSESTHLRCTSCAEFVLPAAAKCKHCGATLAPNPNFFIDKQKADAALNRTSLKIWAGIIAVIVILIVIVPLIAGVIWHK